MSLPDRRTFLLSTLARGACGFEPVYGPGGNAAAISGQVKVAEPHNRNGFDLVQQLELRLGLSHDPKYALSYTIRTDREDLGIAPTQEITRYNIVGKVDFVLTDIASGTVVTSGKVENFVGYSATGTTLSTQTAERDAGSRLMLILADQMVARLLATTPDWAA